MKCKPTFFSALALTFLIMSCSSNESGTSNTESGDTATSTQPAAAQLQEENITYTSDTVTANGYIVYDAAKEGKRPAVLVVHEWWGVNDYVRNRARQLAQMGYIAMAADMFGEGKNAANPQEAEAMATPFYQNPQLTRTRLDAAINKLKTYAQTDTANIAAIGYCYGGYVVLNAAKLGADLKGVASFHGNLSGAPVRKDLLKASVFVAHGAADPFVPEAEVAAFRKSMDSIGANYTFKAYPNATHAFTNPNATETGKKFNIPISYNAAADTASWNDMKAFFGTIFK